ncbi:tetratricopeptide repeat protein [Leucobacter luti]|uniref:Tetratricopeptide repeat protein n=1 Tax=Leucobacter luti TaxID=340320 RepID=A0A4R6S8X3_9MICO|nr:tetratricopeptide repeat protein [Leucobacter luti]TDP95864.1 tetratricopeptide repeat protein [Leucobacter luti]
MPSESWQARVDAVWADSAASPEVVLARIEALVGELDDADPRGPFELGGAHDSAGHEELAVAHYERAIELGLAGTARAELTVQLASTLRVLGRYDEAIALLRASDPDPALGAAPEAFLALALHSAGRYDEALAVSLDALIPQLPRYQRSLRGYAAELKAAAESAPRAARPGAV